MPITLIILIIKLILILILILTLVMPINMSTIIRLIMGYLGSMPLPHMCLKPWLCGYATLASQYDFAIESIAVRIRTIYSPSTCIDVVPMLSDDVNMCCLTTQQINIYTNRTSY